MATRTVFIEKTKKTIALPTEKELLNMLIDGDHPQRGEATSQFLRALGLTALKITRMGASEREEWVRARIKELTGRHIPRTMSVLNKSGDVRAYRIK